MLGIFETLDDTCAFDILVFTLYLMSDRSKVPLKEWSMLQHASRTQKFWQILLKLSKMDPLFLYETLIECEVDLGVGESLGQPGSPLLPNSELPRISEQRVEESGLDGQSESLGRGNKRSRPNPATQEEGTLARNWFHSAHVHTISRLTEQPWVGL